MSTDSFATVAKSVLEDTSLSFSAKGLYSFICSHPENPIAESLRAHPDKKETRKALAELNEYFSIRGIQFLP